jgi:hypothetical protein
MKQTPKIVSSTAFAAMSSDILQSSAPSPETPLASLPSRTETAPSDASTVKPSVTVDLSVHTLARKNARNNAEQDLHVQPQTAPLDVRDIHAQPLAELRAALF